MALKPYGIGVSALCPANINSNIPDAALKTRPEHLKNTGYNISEATQAVLAESQKRGMDPRVLADWLKKGIEDNQFLIVPYKSAARMLEIDLARYYTEYLSPDSMTKYEERRGLPPTDEQKQIFLEKEGYEMGSIVRSNEGPDAGFGKARKDIDWVAPEKRAK